MATSASISNDIDRLPDLTAETLAVALGDHSGVVVIARDRSTDYARGATLGAPMAVQVADRWHKESPRST
jgi:hypothetical protein